jgi:hypothetical protein
MMFGGASRRSGRVTDSYVSKRSMQPHAMHSMRHPMYLRPTLFVVTMAPKSGSATLLHRENALKPPLEVPKVSPLLSKTPSSRSASHRAELSLSRAYLTILSSRNYAALRPKL